MTALPKPAGQPMDTTHGQTMDTPVTGHHGHARVGLYTYPALSGPPERTRSELLTALGYPPPGWHADALCREYPDLSWFPERGDPVSPLKAVCARCLVAEECRTAAVTDPALLGIWGGTSLQERRVIRAAAIGEGEGR